MARRYERKQNDDPPRKARRGSYGQIEKLPDGVGVEKPTKQITALLEEQFAVEWLVDMNAGAAAKRAGFVYRTENTYTSRGNELLRRPRVQQLIRKSLLDRFDQHDVDALIRRTLEELLLLAFSDLRNYKVAPSGALTVRDDLDPVFAEACTRAVRSIKFRQHIDKLTGRVTSQETEIKLWDKNRAMRNLMEYLRMVGPSIGLMVNLPGSKGEAENANQTQVNIVFVGQGDK